MNFDLQYTWDALPRLVEGAWITVKVSFLAFFCAVALGIVIAVARRLERRPVDAAVAVYVSFIRGTPVLIQIYLVYYVLPVVGIDIGAVTAGVLALTLNSAAFQAELFRGGLAALPRGQIEAARSLGISTPVMWLKIILPQLFIATTPPLVNEFTMVVKLTPLVSMITVVELMRVSQQIFSNNFRPIEVLLGAFVLYFFICFAGSQLSRWLEARNELRRA
ncbi:MAG: amino acid ABC transporter permease [Candidatus Tectomicrobia bacterium]|nr:amino acid ABC transporter permease [Candidatus Tectomicrobia bacterium]